MEPTQPAQADPLADLTIITSSMRTRWEPWSQACLERALPQSPRIVVEGRFGWDPLYFAEIAASVSTRYFALIDEDCFVFDADFVRTIIGRLDAEAFDVAGPPDGGTFHRHLNPIACNTYFLIARTEAARRVIAHPGWRALQFNDLDRARLRDEHVTSMQLDATRIDYNLDEPYYPFFWAVLHLGMRILYLQEHLERSLLASVIGGKSTNAGRPPAIIHMWWLRSSAVRDIEPYLGVSHHSRYQRLLADYLRPAFAGPASRRILWSQQLRTIMRRIGGRLLRGKR